MSVFRTFGIFALAFAALAIVAVIVTRSSASTGGHNLTPMAYMAAGAIVLGVGLLLHHKWAAIVFAALFGCAGLWVGVGSIGKVPFPWLFLNLAFGCVLLLPGIITAWRWSDLERDRSDKRRGKPDEERPTGRAL